MPLQDGSYAGSLYRALNPAYSREPLSGRGTGLHGGRFNPKGTLALYTSLDPATALREANQVGNLQPTTLVAYRAELGPIFDTRDAAELKDYGMTIRDLADPSWRSSMLGGRIALTQSFAEALFAAGFAGLLTRSFASGTSGSNLNIVLWRWTGPGTELELVNDENRLARSEWNPIPS